MGANLDSRLRRVQAAARMTPLVDLANGESVHSLQVSCTNGWSLLAKMVHSRRSDSRGHPHSAVYGNFSNCAGVCRVQNQLCMRRFLLHLPPVAAQLRELCTICASSLQSLDRFRSLPALQGLISKLVILQENTHS